MSDSAALRILFFGTPEFAVPALRVLAESRHRVVGVITQPDRPRGRGRKIQPGPVRLEAERHAIALLQPEKIGDPEVLDWARERSADLGCVVAYGQFIPKSIRELPPQRLINAHASLLPRHRGAAPIQHAILAGDRRTGITVMRVEKEMDAGDYCLVREIEIAPNESAGVLSERLSRLAGPTLLEAVDRIAAGAAVFQPQDPAGVTLAPRIGRDFARIDWTQPALALLCRIRALSPSPGIDIRLRPSGVRLKLLEVLPWAGEAPEACAGRIHVAGERLGISALDAWIEVHTLQKPGGRPMGAAEYLRGANVSAKEEATQP